MQYKGYKLLSEIMLVCRQPSITQVDKTYLRAYLVDPSNNKQLQSARNWAQYSEWNNGVLIKHEPDEFTFTNNDFTFELQDCAGGSSQGGKLSFWNCIVHKNGFKFIIGINSDLLLELLKEGTFKNGRCEEPVCFISRNGNTGVAVKDGPSYKLAQEDMNLKNSVKSSLTVKYNVGDVIQTTTKKEVYIGTLYKYYEFILPNNLKRNRYYHEGVSLKDCKFIKYKTPKPVHVLMYLHDDNINKISQLISDGYFYSANLFSPKLPRRSLVGKCLENDITSSDLKQFLNVNHDFNITELRNKYFKALRTVYDSSVIIRFIDNITFGINDEPFEYSSEFIDLLYKHNVTILEEK